MHNRLGVDGSFERAEIAKMLARCAGASCTGGEQDGDPLTFPLSLVPTGLFTSAAATVHVGSAAGRAEVTTNAHTHVRSTCSPNRRLSAPTQKKNAKFYFADAHDRCRRALGKLFTRKSIVPQNNPPRSQTDNRSPRNYLFSPPTLTTALFLPKPIDQSHVTD